MFPASYFQTKPTLQAFAYYLPLRQSMHPLSIDFLFKTMKVDRYESFHYSGRARTEPQLGCLLQQRALWRKVQATLRRIWLEFPLCHMQFLFYSLTCRNSPRITSQSTLRYSLTRYSLTHVLHQYLRPCT